MRDGNACELFVRSSIRPLEDLTQTLLHFTTDTIPTEAGGEVPLVEAATLIRCPCCEEFAGLSLRD